MTTNIAILRHSLPQLEFQANVPLASLSYFRVGGPAEHLVKVSRRDDLVALVQICYREHIPFTALGGASNVVIRDGGIRGLVVFVANDEYVHDNAGLVTAGAGTKMALLVRQTVEDGYTGLEEFLGVPGTLGGAVVNNAHYQHELIGSMITAVEVVQPSGTVLWLPQDECEFDYDHSRFQTSQEVVIQVRFQLQKGDYAVSQTKIRQTTLLRAQTQPIGEPSSGCYFRNVPNTPELQQQFPQFANRREIPTSFLIDQAGFKGKCVGGIHVSQKHAAFLINNGTGTSQDTETLAREIKERIHSLYGVELQPEVFWLGEEKNV